VSSSSRSNWSNSGHTNSFLQKTIRNIWFSLKQQYQKHYKYTYILKGVPKKLGIPREYQGIPLNPPMLLLHLSKLVYMRSLSTTTNYQAIQSYTTATAYCCH
jgi:hypothetical protein